MGALSIMSSFPEAQASGNLVKTLLLQTMFSLGKLSKNHKLPRESLPPRPSVTSSSGRLRDTRSAESLPASYAVLRLIECLVERFTDPFFLVARRMQPAKRGKSDKLYG